MAHVTCVVFLSGSAGPDGDPRESGSGRHAGLQVAEAGAAGGGGEQLGHGTTDLGLVPSLLSPVHPTYVFQVYFLANNQKLHLLVVRLREFCLVIPPLPYFLIDRLRSGSSQNTLFLNVPHPQCGTRPSLCM